jgi:restriction system protein
MPSEFPSQTDFFHAILRHLVEQPDGDLRRNIRDAVPDLLQLSEEQRKERLPNTQVLRYRYKTGWGLTMLKSAGYIENPTHGIWRITGSGRELLKHHPTSFDDETATQLLKEARKSKGDNSPAEPETDSGGSPAQQGPLELIETALTEMKAAVAEELLTRISQAPPEFFESLVLEVLHKSGYGFGTAKESLAKVGGVGDGGIDGIITLDRLGFEKVYVQAKRWKATIGRPEVQAFFGALAGRRAHKGVFITTSSFTKDAQEFAAHVGERNIILIGGAQLTALMIEHGVGVTSKTVNLPKLDSSYFDGD